MTEAKHGTRSGYQTHLSRWGTPPCDACKKAHGERMKITMLVWRDTTRRLRNLHPSEWDAIYAEEKARRGI